MSSEGTAQQSEVKDPNNIQSPTSTAPLEEDLSKQDDASSSYSSEENYDQLAALPKIKKKKHH